MEALILFPLIIHLFLVSGVEGDLESFVLEAEAREVETATLVFQNKHLYRGGGQTVLIEAKKRKVSKLIIFDANGFFKLDWNELMPENNNFKIVLYQPVGKERNGVFQKHIFCPGYSQPITSILNITYNLPNPQSKCDSLNILRGRTLTVSAFGLSPYIVYLPSGKVTGGDADTMKELGKKMGFNVKFKLEKIQFAMNGSTWLGTFGSVRHGTSHIGIGHLPVTAMFHRGVHYTPMIYPLEVKIVSPKPKPTKPFWNIVKPYSWAAWAGILSMVCVVMFVNVGLNLTNSNENVLEGIHVGIRNVLMVFLGQGISHSQLPKTNSSLTLIGLWIFACLILTSSYECNLRAYLMSIDFEPSIDSDQDVLDLNRKLYLPGGNIFLGQYKTSPYKVKRDLGAIIEANNQLYYRTKGKMDPALEQSIIENGDGFILSEHMAKAQFSIFEKQYSGYQPFRLGSSVVLSFRCAYILPKDVPWSDQFGMYTQRLVDGGLIEHNLERQIHPKYLRRQKLDKTSPPKQFQLEHLFGGWFVLASGIFLAAAVFGVEILKKSGDVKRI